MLNDKKLTTMKAALTRATKAVDAAEKRADVEAQREAINKLIKLCNDALRFFESTFHPDCWRKWERAKDDAEQLLRRL